MINNFLVWVVSMVAAFGSWESPITTDVIVEEAIGFNEMCADGEALYWTETHPKEKGRAALVCYKNGKEEFLEENRSVRTRVHEYGGGAFCVNEEGLIFSNDEDRQLYILDKTGQVKQLTDAADWRFADGSFSIWVGEKHGEKVENCLVQIEGKEPRIIASSHDFYLSPRLSPDKKQLAYITWDFPNMQWDSSTLWLADVAEDGSLCNTKRISGGAEESVCQIQWSDEGKLHFVSDKTGFWNLYCLEEESVENLCEIKAEFGVPAWVFGQPTYTFLPDGKILCAYTIKGVDHLGLLDPEKKTLEDLGQPFTAIRNLVTCGEKVYFFGATPTLPSSLICYHPKENTFSIIKQSSRSPITEEWISKGELIEYPTEDGEVGYGFYYPPKNPNFKGLEGEKPPLIVRIHGGPTARAYTQLNLGIQYWTSRGFAFVDVNYGGSTGFGRKYFKRLEGKWGIVDVEDAVSAAQSLVSRGLADPKRLLIRGGSSGGYTALAAIAFQNIFAGGTSSYGIADLELLYKDTHKFEAKYTDLLVAPYPEQVELIRKRSPIHHVEKFSAPILLLQGSEDKIVPPNQAHTMFEALKKRGIPVGMLIFEGEGHGFRQAPNIKRAFDAELYFYSQILGIQLATDFKTPPVEIVTPEAL